MQPAERNYNVHNKELLPGRLSAGPDGLSRRPDHEPPQGAQDNAATTVLTEDRVAKWGVVVRLESCGRSVVVERVAAAQMILADSNILRDIRDAIPDDGRLVPLLGLMQAPALVKSRLRDFTVEDGLIRFRGLIYVPDDAEIKRKILQLYHDSIPAGHPGRVNTLVLVAWNYYWPCMSEFVHRYVDGCEMCQRIKLRQQKPYGPLQPLEVPDGPWQHVSTDYIGPLPTSRGYDMIQVVCDKATKHAHFLGAHVMDDAAAMCNGFMERVWCLHGTPKKVISDRGPQFVAHYVKRMWERLGIKPALSMAHHPQSDGQTERLNQELEVYLRAFIDYYQDNWMDWLPFAEFAYNNQVSAATGMLPFYVEYAYNPTFSVDPVNLQVVPKADEWLDRIREVQEELKGLLELAVARMKRFHDAWVDKSPDYVVGDRVFLERADLRLDRPNHKLDFKRFGPFPISQKISDMAYQLALPDGWAIHDVFHVSCLVPAHEDTILGQQQEPPPPVHMETGDEVEIERILRERRTRGGVSEFLVRWKGYDKSEDKWMKEYDMTHALEAIQEFRANEKARGKSRRGKKKRS
ncbi:hypothetical protein E4T56_gene20327 [Termitomyces sp. T112]|nr:hypothetical protein E4T56_gene20327 [Termitomyces sp. T112]